MKDINELTGTIFQQGPYEYKIKVRQAKVGMDTLNSITITITNLVKVVKGDIIIMALQQLKAYLKGTDEVGLAALYCSEADALGNFFPLLKIPHNAFNMEPLDTQLTVAAQYQDNIVDLEESLRIAGVRKNKVEKTLHHMQRSIIEFQGSPVKIDYVEVQGKLLPSPKGLIPALYIEIYAKVHENFDYRDYKDLLKTHIMDMFMEFCPIEIKQKDNIRIII